MNNPTFTDRYFTAMKQGLDSTQISTLKEGVIDRDAGFNALCELAARLKTTGGTLYFVGNGASAMMSSHMAVDFCKNGGVRSLALNDAAFLTAIGNDIGYSQAFEMPLAVLGRPEDALVTISSSGNSPNVLEAIKAARKIGMGVVTFSGMKPANASRQLGDVNVYVPSKTYGVAESIHAVLLHCWLDRFMNICE